MTRILSTALLAAATLFASTDASANSYGLYGDVYDVPSTNLYTIYNTPASTSLYGSSLSTGSTWSGTYNSNGSSWGIDSSGNSWTYDSRTSIYTNSSGKVCVGTGRTRTCY